MLRTIETDELEMAFKTAMQAGLFRPVSDDAGKLLCLVMPLRLPDEEVSGADKEEEKSPAQ
jgi:hypothetical protein